MTELQDCLGLGTHIADMLGLPDLLLCFTVKWQAGGKIDVHYEYHPSLGPDENGVLPVAMVGFRLRGTEGSGETITREELYDGRA